ncbi:hypothetical protein BpHYR1_023127 [Brachionus plicatilis]|uniref:Uncharacterized protein n=1 Tax=Brachionus plicatilis TaxID=10195 RepID=A0A3M7QK41_BRAPC|nr:hypothetical protein BpHYR1_023127 [Brachionus plicatilis]
MLLYWRVCNDEMLLSALNNPNFLHEDSNFRSLNLKVADGTIKPSARRSKLSKMTRRSLIFKIFESLNQGSLWRILRAFQKYTIS